MLLVDPATMEEYGRALDTIERSEGSAGRGGRDAGRGEGRPARGAYVVTTAAQRDRWGLGPTWRPRAGFV